MPIMVPAPTPTDGEAATPLVLTAALQYRPAHHHCPPTHSHKYSASTNHEPQKAAPHSPVKQLCNDPHFGDEETEAWGGQSAGSMSEWVSLWQNTVGPHSARLAASCKQPLRFPECQSPETTRKNDMQKKPALLERRTQRIFTDAQGLTPCLA